MELEKRQVENFYIMLNFFLILILGLDIATMMDNWVSKVCNYLIYLVPMTNPASRWVSQF